VGHGGCYVDGLSELCHKHVTHARRRLKRMSAFWKVHNRNAFEKYAFIIGYIFLLLCVVIQLFY